MLVQAFTVFLALIGTTLSCMNTGARVTYAMGRDEEVPCALRHAARQEAHAAPRRSGRWRSSRSSSASSPSPSISAARRRRRSTRSTTTSGTASASSTRTLIAKLPNTLVIVTLISNFGTFLLYMITCIVAIVAFREHHMLPRLQAHGRAGVRAAGEPRLHAVLPRRAVHGQRDEREGAVHRARHLRACGASTAGSTSCARARRPSKPVLLSEKPVVS